MKAAPLINSFAKTEAQGVADEAQYVQEGAFAGAVAPDQDGQRAKLNINISEVAKVFDLNAGNHSLFVQAFI